MKSIVCAFIAAGAMYGQLTYDRLLKSDAEPQNWLTYSGSYNGWRYSKYCCLGLHRRTHRQQKLCSVWFYCRLQRWRRFCRLFRWKDLCKYFACCGNFRNSIKCISYNKVACCYR